MNLDAVVYVFLLGCAMIVVSYSSSAAQNVVRGIEALRDELNSAAPWERRPQDSEPDGRGFGIFLRVLGAGLILISVAAFADRF